MPSNMTHIVDTTYLRGGLNNPKANWVMHIVSSNNSFSNFINNLKPLDLCKKEKKQWTLGSNLKFTGPRKLIVTSY